MIRINAQISPLSVFSPPAASFAAERRGVVSRSSSGVLQERLKDRPNGQALTPATTQGFPANA